MMTGREFLFAVVITAIAGSLLQDLAWIAYVLPNFLRPAKTQPEATDPPIMASVLGDMQSLGLVELTPDADPKPTIQRPRQAEDQHPSEKAAA
jgi:hypothetical protein